MVKLSEITEFIETLFPPEYAEDFDNIGLLVGRRDKDVTKVIVCLDANKNVVYEAAEKGVSLIITHHPVIFNPIKRITDDNDAGEMLIYALENGISIYSAHTNLDSAPQGLTDEVCKKLNLSPIANMEGNLGRICSAAEGTTAKLLTAKIKQEFGIDTLYSTFTADKEIKTAAVCNGGGGGELVDIAAKLGADVYISGDLKHHEVSNLKINDNIDFIEMRHYDSEKIVTELIKRKLEEKFGERLEIIISDVEVSPLLDTDKII